MGDNDTTLEIKGLEQILKALKGRQPTCRIGILGGGARSKGKATNAEIGAVHEYGSPSRHIPQRSFLRIPLMEHLNKKIEASGALDKDVLKEVIKSGTVKPWLTKVAVIAYDVVMGGFASNGYGKWAAWKGNYKSHTGNILVDTTQLRQSISYEVKA